MISSLQRARLHSETSLKSIREAAHQIFGDMQSLLVGLNGSFARREATAGSDVDIFYLCDDPPVHFRQQRKIFEEKLVSSGFKLPSKDGVFSDVLPPTKLLSNIGGLDDDNTSITRRLLLLLEGEWLLNEGLFHELRAELVRKYVSDETPSAKIALFLLNDIIRFWRTICVDYEYKINETGKAKGIRLVKLRFSRMLLAFGGIVTVAETHGLDAGAKRARIKALLSLDVVSRVRLVFGTQSEQALGLYGSFLACLDDEAQRRELEAPDFPDKESFKQLRNQGREFRDCLIELLSVHYAPSHPIHKALIL